MEVALDGDRTSVVFEGLYDFFSLLLSLSLFLLGILRFA